MSSDYIDQNALAEGALVDQVSDLSLLLDELLVLGGLGGLLQVLADLRNNDGTSFDEILQVLNSVVVYTIADDL